MNAYIVIDNNMLGYTRTGWSDAGILASSPIRGACHFPVDGPYPLPRDKKRIRPATKQDFIDFRVCPRGHIE